MDDKTFIAAYVAQEAQRINQRLKGLVQSPERPPQEECDAVMADIDETLSRLQRALSQVQTMIDSEEHEGEPA